MTKIRKYIRLLLLMIIIGLGISIFIERKKSLSEEEFNFKAIKQIEHNYMGDNFYFIVIGDNKNSVFFPEIIKRINQEKTSSLW